PENEITLTKFGKERFINYVYIDEDRQLFFERWPKLAVHPVLKLIDLNTGITRQFDLRQQYGIGYHQIRGLLTQQNGRRWLYGLPFLAEYAGNNNPLQFIKKDYNKDHDLKFNQIFSMYEDRQRNVWICTDNGIYLFNPDAQLFHNYSLTTPKRYAVEGKAQVAMQLPNREIWLGYRDLGLFRYNSSMQPLPLPASIVPLLDEKSVWDLHLHSNTGQIWIGLQGGQLIVYDTLSKHSQLLSPSSFEQRAVKQIAEDKEGNLWFGTQGGNVVKWSRKPGRLSSEEGFSLVKKTGVIERLFVDSGGFLWVAAIGEGLLKINTANGQVVAQFNDSRPAGQKLWNNNPKDILPYNDSLLVVAAGALNLVNRYTHQVRFISSLDGLP
ncbi:MAG TPA: two-component regulator propeller domain-containing protein, partial [Flavisolibacter sp.]|nr:two-component regulator propeller domain-containing protein [Flavisolibacter sp.]